MKPALRGVANDRIAAITLAGLAAMTLVFSAACRADDAPAVTSLPDAASTLPEPDTAPARIVRRPPAAHLTVAQRIDEGVHRLASALDLDVAQQQELRQILVDQQRRMMRLRGAPSIGSAGATSTMLAISDQTKARIRAMLNDEQRKKYGADVPRDGLAPAQADLAHWMDLQEAKRRQDQAEDNPK